MSAPYFGAGQSGRRAADWDRGRTLRRVSKSVTGRPSGWSTHRSKPKEPRRSGSGSGSTAVAAANGVVDGVGLKQPNSSASLRSEEDGLIVVNNDEDLSPSYYVNHGLHLALSKADENGYRHDVEDEENDYCFLYFLFVMLRMKELH